MRGRRGFVVLTIYLSVMSALIAVAYLAFSAAAGNPFGPNSRQAGKVVFSIVLMVQIFLVIFVGPGYTSAAITGEKERQTYDLLRTTLLSARALVTGKLLSALGYVFLLIIASIPLQSIAFLLGGVSPIELIISQLLVAISAITFALIGLFFSTFMRTTLAASISTTVVAFTLTIFGPIVAFIVVAFMGPVLFGSTSPSWLLTAILLYGGLFLAATNLPATLVLSEVFLLENDALFVFTEFIDGHRIIIFSPWFVYLFLYGLLALILYWITVRRVRRIADR